MRKLRLPELTPGIVRNEVELWGRIDEVLRADPRIRRSAHYLLEAQRALRRSTEDLGWSAYGWVEAEHNSRAGLAYLILVRWAFREGVKHGQRGRG